MDLFDVLVLSGRALLALNLLFLFIIRKHLRRAMILLSVLLIGIAIIEIMASYLARQGLSNQHLTHFYTIGRFLMLSIMYYGQLRKFQRIVPIGVAVFSVVLIYQMTYSSIRYYEFNTLGFLISACILILYAMAYYIEHISTKRYWDMFNIGLFLYLGGSSIIFLTMNSWQNLKDWNYVIWSVNASLFVVFQGFVMATIYRFKKTTEKNGISPL